MVELLLLLISFIVINILKIRKQTFELKYLVIYDLIFSLISLMIYGNYIICFISFIISLTISTNVIDIHKLQIGQQENEKRLQEKIKKEKEQKMIKDKERNEYLEKRKNHTLL